MSEAEKTCPKCAETVKAAAQVCRHCGHQFSKPLMTNNAFGCLVLVAVVAAIGWLADPVDDGEAGDAPAVLLSAERRAGCAKAVADATSNRIVRERPAPNRVNVDELTWAGMAATDKTALLALVGCDTFGKQFADYALGEYVVAYGYRSGKRLAMLNSVGMSYE